MTENKLTKLLEALISGAEEFVDEKTTTVEDRLYDSDYSDKSVRDTVLPLLSDDRGTAITYLIYAVAALMANGEINAVATISDDDNCEDEEIFDTEEVSECVLHEETAHVYLKNKKKRTLTLTFKRDSPSPFSRRVTLTKS